MGNDHGEDTTPGVRLPHVEDNGGEASTFVGDSSRADAALDETTPHTSPEVSPDDAPGATHVFNAPLSAEPSAAGELTDSTENTVIDSELASRLRDGPEAAESSAAATGRLDRGLEGLGPAFPDEDEDSAPPLQAPATAAAGRRPEPRAPLGGPAAPVGEDGWEGFEEDSGWSSITSERRIEPAIPEAQGSQYSHRDTNVYKLGTKVQPEEGARLVCTAGKDSSREFAVDRREMSIGRDPENSIVLVDGSVSREHARLLHESGVYTLVDLRSANGTFVNGQRASRSRVRSGDEVGFGSTRFRFLEIGDVFKPVDASGAPVLPGARQSLWRELRSSRHLRTVAAGVATLAGAAIVIAVVVLLRGGSGGGHATRDTIFQYYLQGVEAFKRRQWDEAATQFSILLGLDPKHARGQSYRDEVARERAFEKQMEDARRAREAKDLGQAYALLSAVNDSVYSTEAEELLRGIDADLDLRVARARMALDTGDGQEAAQLLQGVEAVKPGRPDVLALLDRAQRVVESKAPSSPESSSSSGTRSRVPSSSTSSRSHGSSSRPPAERVPERSRPDGTAGQAAGLFAEGKIKEALSVLEGQGENRDALILRAKIEKFSNVYEGALEEHRAKRTNEAIRELKKAKAFEAKITGGRSRIADEIDRKLADMYYVQGIAPLLERRYPEAYKSFKTAVSYTPEHGPSLAKLDDLARKAKEVFEDGYRSKDTDPAAARERWKTVLQMVPSDHEYYRKAKQWLDSLPSR